MVAFGILQIACIVLTTQSRSQEAQFSYEEHRIKCELWEPRIHERDPGPKWSTYNPRNSNQILHAIEIDGVVIPHFSLEEFDEVEHPDPTTIWFKKQGASVIQTFERSTENALIVVGQDYVDRGLVDGPHTVYDLDRRQYGLDPQDVSCNDVLPTDAPKTIFNHYLDMLSLVLNLPFGDRVIDTGEPDDYILVMRNVFTFFKFADSGVVYHYSYTSDDQKFEQALNNYIWALENGQYKIVQNEQIATILSYEISPEEQQEAAQHDARIWEYVQSLPQ